LRGGVMRQHWSYEQQGGTRFQKPCETARPTGIHVFILSVGQRSAAEGIDNSVELNRDV